LIILLAASIANAASLEEAVVKVTSTRRFPNVTRPWMKLRPTGTTGTGVVISGSRVLTCAHLVTDAGEVTLQGHDSGRRVDAKVQVIGPDIDLAILTPSEPELLARRSPLPRSADLPAVMAPVLVYGFPIGGNGLSVTRGIVSRVVFGRYAAGSPCLQLQVDAAINPGNSGGPALAGGKMVGLASSRLVGAEGISFILPNEEIDTFLDDMKDGRYDGKPWLAGQFQATENEGLRFHDR
jgi:S1-C subfamily serine protease